MSIITWCTWVLFKVDSSQTGLSNTIQVYVVPTIMVIGLQQFSPSVVRKTKILHSKLQDHVVMT